MDKGVFGQVKFTVAKISERFRDVQHELLSYETYLLAALNGHGKIFSDFVFEEVSNEKRVIDLAIGFGLSN